MKEDVLYPSTKLILVYIVYAVLIACCIFTRVSQHTKVVQIITIMTYGCATVHMSRFTKKLVRQRSYWRRSGNYVQRHVCFVNIQLSLHENVVFSVRARMGNTPYIIFIMWNSISGLDALYHLLVVVWLSW